jgi:hypothetical protein
MRKMIKKYPPPFILACVGLLFLSISSCAVIDKPEAPCFDGWTTDGSGRSSVWQPNETETIKIRELLPVDEIPVCYHRLPSGKVIVLTSLNGDIHYVSLMPKDDSYEVIDTGLVLEQ